MDIEYALKNLYVLRKDEMKDIRETKARIQKLGQEKQDYENATKIGN